MSGTPKTACFVPAPASAREVEIYRKILHMHCDRKDEPGHECKGAMTIRHKHITLSCPLCGDSPEDHAVTIQIGRIAIREIDDEVRFYYAAPDTMDGALLMASIKANLVRRKPQRMDAMIALMREVLGDIIEESTGVRPAWPDPPKPAPESERGIDPAAPPPPEKTKGDGFL